MVMKSNKPKNEDTNRGILPPIDTNPLSKLTRAIQRGDLQGVENLLNQGENINKQDFIDKGIFKLVNNMFVKEYAEVTPLILSIQLNMDGITKLLIERGANVNIYDEFKNTPLMYMAMAGKTEFVEELIKKGAKLNIRNLISGQTALHYAIEQGHTDLAKLLIESGANYKLENKEKKTALSLAIEKGNMDVVNLINEKEEEKSQELEKMKVKVKRDLKNEMKNREGYDMAGKAIDTYVDLKMGIDTEIDLKQMNYGELNDLLKMYNKKQDVAEKKDEVKITQDDIKDYTNRNVPIFIRGVNGATGINKSAYDFYSAKRHNESGIDMEIRKIKRKFGDSTLTKISGVKTGNYNRCVTIVNHGKVTPFVAVGFGIVNENKSVEDIKIAVSNDASSKSNKEEDIVEVYRRDSNYNEHTPMKEKIGEILEDLKTSGVKNSPNPNYNYNEIVMNIENNDVKFIYWVNDENGNFNKLQAIFSQRKYEKQTGRNLPIFEYRKGEENYLSETKPSKKQIIDMIETEIMEFDERGNITGLKSDYNQSGIVDFLQTFKEEIEEIPNSKQILQNFVDNKINEFLNGATVSNIYDIVNIIKYSETIYDKQTQQNYLKTLCDKILDDDTIIRFLTGTSNTMLYNSKRKNREVDFALELLSEIRAIATEDTMTTLAPKFTKFINSLDNDILCARYIGTLKSKDAKVIAELMEQAIEKSKFDDINNYIEKEQQRIKKEIEEIRVKRMSMEEKSNGLMQQYNKLINEINYELTEIMKTRLYIWQIGQQIQITQPIYRAPLIEEYNKIVQNCTQMENRCNEKQRIVGNLEQAYTTEKKKLDGNSIYRNLLISEEIQSLNYNVLKSGSDFANQILVGVQRKIDLQKQAELQRQEQQRQAELQRQEQLKREDRIQQIKDVLGIDVNKYGEEIKKQIVEMDDKKYREMMNRGADYRYRTGIREKEPEKIMQYIGRMYLDVDIEKQQQKQLEGLMSKINRISSYSKKDMPDLKTSSKDTVERDSKESKLNKNNATAIVKDKDGKLIINHSFNSIKETERVRPKKNERGEERTPEQDMSKGKK